MTKRKIEYWVIPPEQDAEFVACMEDVLETYAAAYDPKHPVLCMDEQPVQLLKETRVPIAATAQHGKRVDYEYERHGTASIFMFAEPLSGFRQATARTRRTKADWAIEVAQILDTRYADCEYVTLVCDNLNTHTKGAFYEAFEPDRARAYLKRIKFCYTPKHGRGRRKIVPSPHNLSYLNAYQKTNVIEPCRRKHNNPKTVTHVLMRNPRSLPAIPSSKLTRRHGGCTLR